MGYSLGIDLGTTFVAAAVVSTSRVEMVTLGDRLVVAPAAVCLREDGTLVTGEAALLQWMSSPDRVSREVKRRLGNPTPIVLGGQSYPATALLGALLRDVVRKVVQTEGTPPDRLVLTHPANWGPFRRALFEEVAQHAGLENTPTVTEPEAVAAHYAASRLLSDGQTVAVYDLGGGTFDATVVRKHAEGVQILGTPEGIERLGGVEIDDAIVSHVDHAAGGALSELDQRDPPTAAALARLRQDCVLAKEALSVDTETVIPVFLPGRHFDVRITRVEFEDMVRAQIEATIAALSRTLHSAGVAPDELSAVLLVGGSSRIPLVARMVSAELGRPTVVDTHPEYAAALGAATLADAAATTLASGIRTQAAWSETVPAAVIPTQRGQLILARGLAEPVAPPAPVPTVRPAGVAPAAPGRTPAPGNGHSRSGARGSAGSAGAAKLPPLVPAAPLPPPVLSDPGPVRWMLLAAAVLAVLAAIVVVVVVGYGWGVPDRLSTTGAAQTISNTSVSNT